MVVHPFWRETAFSAALATGKRRQDAQQLRHEPDINTQRSTNYVTQCFIAVDGVVMAPPRSALQVPHLETTLESTHVYLKPMRALALCHDYPPALHICARHTLA